MCGIAGICNGNLAPADTAILDRMIRRIRYRGVDDLGIVDLGPCALANARLSIVDLSGGRQPMCSKDGSLVVTFNGEIFNHQEIRASLVRRGRVFCTHSDTEVLLQLYLEQGEECVHLLNGQWAFAIWNLRKQELFASRDRMGVRPFFYALSGNTFLFASEMKALFAHPAISPELDEIALQQVCTFWHTIPPRTIFKGLAELPPAHSLTFRDGRLTVKRYWNLAYGSPSRLAEQDAAEKLAALLYDATRIRLRGDVPVGAYVSGGLDSAVIAATMRKIHGGRFKTFSVRFESPSFDEGFYQRQLVRQIESDHNELLCSNMEIACRLPETIWHLEQPVVRLAPVPLLMLARLVRATDCKAVLTGEGADEILGGYQIFKECKIRQFWSRRPESRLRPLLLRRLYPYLPNVGKQPDAYLRAFFDFRPDLASVFFSHRRRWSLAARLTRFFSRSLRWRLSSYDPLAELESALPPAYRSWDWMGRAQYVETAWFLPGVILSSQGDRVAMAHSIEGRFPFLDPRAVEFANALPAELKMKVLCEKYLLKRSSAGLVPPSIATRTKQPYRAPEAGEVFSARCPPYVRELLDPGRIAQDDVFDPVAAGCLLQKLSSGRLIGATDSMALTLILSTQLLLDTFIHARNTTARYGHA
jgi:asparagine synthase (glutamine-hydrolysing)